MSDHEFRQGRPPIYPWDEWLDGRLEKLYTGYSFNGDPVSFRVLCHKTAAKRGHKVHTEMFSETDADSGEVLTGILIEAYDDE